MDLRISYFKFKLMFIKQKFPENPTNFREIQLLIGFEKQYFLNIEFKHHEASFRLYCRSSTVFFNIFSINMPYPLVGSLTSTWVTAPINFPF